jgi:5-methyltetrahydropteroyltriglutamate--homocysteine methyltransferase
MRRSTEQILTTHTGSLPRSPELTGALQARDRSQAADGDLDAQIRAGVAEAVRNQIDAGVAVVNDGEASKIGYATYVKERLDGFGDQGGLAAVLPEVEEFPEYMGAVLGGLDFEMPACVGPVAYRDRDGVRTDIENLRAGGVGAARILVGLGALDQRRHQAGLAVDGGSPLYVALGIPRK